MRRPPALRYGGERLTISLDPADTLALIDELREIAARRSALPEFLERLLQVVEALPHGFETRRIDAKNGRPH